MPAATVPLGRSPNEPLSREVQELIRYNPHWIIRKGNLIFLLILSILLSIAWVVKYPDTLTEPMKLTAVDAPKLIIARSEGKLQKLLVSNEQEVKQGQPLAFLQSTASHEQVFSLQSWIGGVEPLIKENKLEELLSCPLPALNELGEIQSGYQDFQGILKETLEVLLNGYYQQKRQALEKDLYFLSALQANAQEQEKVMRQDYELQQIEYQANQSLATDKVIAPLELNQNKSKVLSKEQGLKQIKAQLINDDMATHAKNKELLDLRKYMADQRQKFSSALFDLKSKISEWMKQYVITASEDGKVLFVSFLQENEQIANGQEIFHIEPLQSLYYGQMMASQSSLGKMRTGQKVLIRMDSYPSSEFGYLTGVISYISPMPTSGDSFLIKVDLPDGLRTSYHKMIFFRNNLSARAEVITDNRRLLGRFLVQIKEIFNK